MSTKSSVLFVVGFIGAVAIACSDKTIVQGGPGVADGGTSSSSGGSADGGADDDDDAGDDDDSTPKTQCTAAAKKLLHPQTKVSTGEVKIIETVDGVAKVYVDASAGGAGGASDSNPRVYLTLAGKKVEINDVDAETSTDWDIAFKRVDIFTNGGDGGPGKGAAVMVEKDFADVTAADGKDFAQEKFFTGDCEAQKDNGGFLLTSFSSWYDYDDMTHIPTPYLNRTFVVKAADGTLFKVGLLAYQGKNDGTTTGGQTGQFVFQVKKL
jgi:hypothetical protein